MFESFSNEDYEMQIFEKVYQEWKAGYEKDDLFEQGDFWEEPETLTSGERAAAARDFQILTKGQLAALYLRALGVSQDEPGRYLVGIDGIEKFGETDTSDGSFLISVPALADAIGLDSRRTASRTINKFVNLIDGVGETSSETIYNKIIDAYEYFKNATVNELSSVVSSIIQDPNVSTKNREAQEQEREAQVIKREQKKMSDLETGQRVFSLLSALKSNPAFRETGKALGLSINRIAKDYGLDPIKVKQAYKKFLSDKGILSSLNYVD